MPWYASFFEILIHSAVAGLLILTVCSLALAFFVRQPIRRERLIHWSLWACLIAPIISFFPGVPHWSLAKYQAPANSESSSANEPEAPIVIQKPISIEEELSDISPDHVAAEREPVAYDKIDGVSETLFTGVESSASNSISTTDPKASAVAIDYRLAVVSLYLIGMTGMAVWWFLGLFGLWRLSRRASPAPDDIRKILHSLGGDASRKVKLLVSAKSALPITFTGRSPVIILPEGMCRDAGSKTLCWSLAHEWAHVEHRHSHTWLLSSLVRVLYFYQPPIWWLRGRLRLAQDYLADDRAAREAPQPEDYAQFLTGLLAKRLSPTASLGLAIAGRKTQIYRRVVMLTKNDNSLETRCPRLWTSLAFLTCTAVLVLAAGYQLNPVEAEEKKNLETQSTDETEPPEETETTQETNTEETSEEGAETEDGTDSTAPEESSEKAKRTIHVEYPDDTDVFVLRGRKEDVERLLQELKKKSSTQDSLHVDKEDLRYQGKSFKQWQRTLLTELDSESRVGAIQAMGAFRDQGYEDDIIKTMGKILHEKNSYTSKIALAACRQLRIIGPKSLPTLISVLKHDSDIARRIAADELRNIHPKAESAVPALIETLQDSSKDVRRYACLAIGSIGTSRNLAVPALITAIEDGDPKVREAALRGLSNYSPADDKMLQALLKATTDSNGAVQWGAIVTMTRIGPPTKEVIKTISEFLIYYDNFNAASNAHEFTSPDTNPEIIVPVLTALLKENGRELRGRRLSAARLLSLLGKKAKPATLDIVQAFTLATTPQRIRFREHTDLLDALNRLGPDAIEAAPELSQWLANHNKLLKEKKEMLIKNESETSLKRSTSNLRKEIYEEEILIRKVEAVLKKITSEEK